MTLSRPAAALDSVAVARPGGARVSGLVSLLGPLAVVYVATFLASSAGAPLAEASTLEEDLSRWEVILAQYAVLQRELAAHDRLYDIQRPQQFPRILGAHADLASVALRLDDSLQPLRPT